MVSGEGSLRSTGPRPAGEATAFLILDTESVPDGRLIGKVRYPEENLSPEEAVSRAQAEARERAYDGSDFLPATFQYPVAVCAIRVGPDYGLQKVTCLDAPQFRPREIVRQFWHGLGELRARLVTFNGRGFDLPLLELAAFRYGCCGRDHFGSNRYSNRNRYSGNHIDLMEWLGNYGACRLAGGLDLLSKLLGKPGKMEMAGDQVYALHQAGRQQEINDYCLCDTLDTYFVFLRTRVLSGDLTLEEEHERVQQAHAWLTARTGDLPGIAKYLANWGAWEPWP